MACHYTVYRVACRDFTTLVAVFKQESTFLKYIDGKGKYIILKNKRETYSPGTIYGPASGFVIRENFEGRPFFELQRHMQKIGNYREEILS